MCSDNVLNWPTEQYATIVADPPWQVKAGRPLGRYTVKNGKQLFDGADNRARALAYPTMTVAEIAELNVGDISEPNAHLYLWTINRYLSEAFEVAKAWGFRYSTTLVWAKSPMGGGLGGCYGISTEYVLFCRRGSLHAKTRMPSTWFNWKRPYDSRGKPKHSAKPPQFMDMVESVSPGPYIELFARTRRPGWQSWGNEIDNAPGTTPACSLWPIHTQLHRTRKGDEYERATNRRRHRGALRDAHG